jgi:L-fuconate dehydratase
MTTITAVRVEDIRFPTSQSLDGSDAMNPDPTIRGLCDPRNRHPRSEGHGLTFTIGRGNEICCAAIKALASLLVG